MSKRFFVGKRGLMLSKPRRISERSVHRVLGASPLLVALLAAAAAAAKGDSAIKVLSGLEVAIPDSHIEWERGDAALTLAWPLHVELNRLSRRLPDPDRLWWTVFVEPQGSPAREAARLLLGTRAFVFLLERGQGLGAIVEAAGLAGTDGHGGAVGAGLALGDTDFSHSTGLGLVYRYVVTTEAPRHVLMLDLATFPF